MSVYSAPVTITMLLIAGCVCAGEPDLFTAGDREVVATKEQRDANGLKWFMDGNLGVLRAGDHVQLYGANGSQPVRVTGTQQNPLLKVESVSIATRSKHFRYLSGGPVYRDPQSKRIFLFYHAEIHRGTASNFYSIIGLCVQTDDDGLEFTDLGPVFAANTPSERAEGTVEICGAPYVIKDGYFYVYARDELSNGKLKQSNLSVAKARVSDVVRAGLEGKSAEWMKYHNKAFTEPAVGGRSTPLEKHNPQTRWMDVSYNTALEKYIMVVAVNTSPGKVELFLTCSDDGITWAERRKLADEEGESFYPSIVGFGEDPRQTGPEFYIYYTFSRKGEWDRWSDAEIVRRRITVRNDRSDKSITLLLFAAAGLTTFVLGPLFLILSLSIIFKRPVSWRPWFWWTVLALLNIPGITVLAGGTLMLLFPFFEGKNMFIIAPAVVYPGLSIFFVLLYKWRRSKENQDAGVVIEPAAKTQ